MSPAKSTAAPRSRSTAERVTVAVSVAVIVALVAVILTLWGRTAAPASLSVDTADPVAQNGQFSVAATITNDGSTTAAEVQVVAELRMPGSEPVEADQVVDFLAGGEEATVVFVFDDDPRDGELEVRVASYTDP